MANCPDAREYALARESLLTVVAEYHEAVEAERRTRWLQWRAASEGRDADAAEAAVWHESVEAALCDAMASLDMAAVRCAAAGGARVWCEGRGE